MTAAESRTELEANTDLIILLYVLRASFSIEDQNFLRFSNGLLFPAFFLAPEPVDVGQFFSISLLTVGQFSSHLFTEDAQ